MTKNVYADRVRKNKQLENWLETIAIAKFECCADLLSKIADEFENDLLECEVLPNNYFKIIIELLSNEKYYNKPGVWNFVLVLNNIMDSIEESQVKELIGVFLDNFKNYKNKELSFSVCDFVARNISYPLAASVLEQLKEKEKGKAPEFQGYADEGFFILNQEGKRSLKQGSDKINFANSIKKNS